MGKERGKRTKKIIHLLHLLMELLRQISSASATSFGKTARSASRRVKGKSKESEKNVSKSATSKSAVTLDAKGSLEAESASSSSSAGLTAGTIVSVKTLGMVVIIGGLFFSGLGVYGYSVHENPLNLFGTLSNGHGTTGNTVPNQPTTSTQPTVNPTGQSTGHSSLTLSASQYSNIHPSPTSHQHQTNTTKTSLDDNGTTPPTINYTVPENP